MCWLALKVIAGVIGTTVLSLFWKEDGSELGGSFLAVNPLR